MSTIQLQEKLHGYGQWREKLIQGLDRYTQWVATHEADHEGARETIQSIRESLHSDRLVWRSRGVLSRQDRTDQRPFLSDTGVRLLPSQPGRTTMCPTEYFTTPLRQLHSLAAYRNPAE